MQAAATTTRDVGASGALRRKRDFQLILSGFSISTLGSRLSTVAYPLLVLALTGSPAEAGWIGFAAIAPGILIYLPAGALVDKSDLRRTMLLSECGRGLAIAVVVIALMLGRPSMMLLILAALTEQTLKVLSTLAEQRFVRTLLEPDNEAAGLAHSQAWTQTAVLVGRPLGGFLFGVSHLLPFAADVVSFCVSVGVLLRIRKRHEPSRQIHSADWRLRQGIGEALGWLRANAFARVAMPLTAGTTLIAQALIMIFLAEAEARQLSPIMIGVVLGSSGLGGALGSAAAPWLFRQAGYALLKFQMWAWAAALALLWWSGGRSFACVAYAMFVLGFTGALGNVAVDTYLVRTAAKSMLARVMSVDRLSSLGAFAVGPLIGGLCAQWYGTQRSVFILLLATVGLAVIAFAVPSRPERAVLG